MSGARPWLDDKCESMEIAAKSPTDYLTYGNGFAMLHFLVSLLTAPQSHANGIPTKTSDERMVSSTALPKSAASG